MLSALLFVMANSLRGIHRAHRPRPTVERTPSWRRRNRRLMAHYEALAIIAEGFVKLPMISSMLKRLTETKAVPTA